MATASRAGAACAGAVGRVALPDGWTLWDRFMVRAAGMPTGLALALASDAPADVSDAAWAAARDAERAALRQAAQRPDVREALLWQNRPAVATGLDPWLASPPDRDDARTRKRERMALAYVLRYATKNDTIGFFGPVGWGVLDPGAPGGMAFAPGAGLVSVRTTYVEPWAVAAFLDRWLAEPAFVAAVPWRLHPRLWLRDGRLFGVPGTRSADGGRALPPAELAVLTALAGPWPGGEAAEALRARGWIVPALAVPWSADPLGAMRRALAGLPENPAVAAARADLTWLARRRGAIARAAGDPAALDRALGALARGFTARTGQAAQRHEGRTYGGRTLVYEDAVRDLGAVAGRGLLDAVAAPLALVLAAARWHGWTAGERFRTALAAIDARLRARHGEAYGLPFLWDEVGALLYAADPLALAAQRDELAARWAAALDVSGDAAGPVRRRAADVCAAVRRHLGAPGPGFMGARHHGVDLLPAEGPDGPYVVLGELHPAVHPFATLTARQQHPDPASLDAAFAADLPGLSGLPALADAFCRSGQDARLAPGWWHVLVDPVCGSWRPADRQLAMGTLEVRPGPRGPWVARRGGEALFPAERLFERWLRLLVAGTFRLVPDAPRWPRVAIDGLVVGRATWRVAPSDLAAALAARGAERFRRLRVWGDGLGLPPRVFVACPEEAKPFMYDRGSVLGAERFAAVARQASRLTIAEMLPDLPDAVVPGPGGRYTGELRLAAVDPLAYEDAAP